MANNAQNQKDFVAWATAVGAAVEDVGAAWQDLERRGLLSAEDGQIAVSPLAMRRATTPTQRRLAAHLSGYLLTDNPYIVRREGDPPGNPAILNTRIAVEHIASYFNQGWGVTEIERDLHILTRDEIEAAIQYYLNHRSEIDQDMRRSRRLYETHAPKAISAGEKLAA